MLLRITSTAQQYKFIQYSIEEGLAHSQVEAAFQDRDGYLWFGTLGGASRFDGIEFINYSTENGLLDNQVNAFCQDRRGDVWIASPGGVTKFNGTQFIAYPLSDSLIKYNVKSIAEDREGNIWIATDGAGAFRLKGASWVRYTMADGLTHNFIRSIATSEDGTLWFVTKAGISQWMNGHFVNFRHPQLEQVKISQVLFDSEGRMWFTTFGNGVFLLEDDRIYNMRKQDGLISDWIRAIIRDHTGSFWCASKEGLSKLTLNNHDRTTTVIYTNFNAENGLDHENLNGVTTDFEGNLWLATDGGGVLKFTGEAFVNYTTKDGLGSNIVMSIVEDKDRNIWFSTYDNGITRFDGVNYTYYSNKDVLKNNTVWTSLFDHRGRLWFGTSDGAYHFDGTSFKRIGVEDGLIGKKITAIFQDRQHNIWFGAREGITKFDGTSFMNVTAKSGKIGKRVRNIMEDSKGLLWFGTTNGLYRYDGHEFARFTTKDGLTDDIVYAICEDDCQHLWIGTKNGLTCYDGKEFWPIKLSANLNTNFTNFLVLGPDNYLWVGTNNGIYKLDIHSYHESDTLMFDHYTTQEGINSLETNLNGAFKDSKGNLWMCTSNGVVKYDPSKENRLSEQIPPFIHIAGIRLFREKTNWKKYTKRIDSNGLPMKLSVKYNKNNFTFDFVGISHNDPAEVMYQFRLWGFEETWSPLTKARFATYANIPPGDYTFMVRAINKEGVISTGPATFNFSVLPPFWMTWWFYCLVSVFLLGSGYSIYRWRKAVAKRKQETQQLVYKSKLLALEQQTLNASMNRHFVFNALNSIQYYINKQDKLSANRYLTSFAQLIRKNLDSSQSNTVILADEIERLELYLTLEEMRFKDKFEYEIIVDERVDTERLRIPSMLLQPFVENSITHGILPMEKKGKVTVNIRTDGNGSLIFSIKDNGIGIETSLRNKTEHEKDHISKGMAITKNRIDILRKMSDQENIFVNGPVELKGPDNIVEGTHVEIILPLNENYFEENA